MAGRMGGGGGVFAGVGSFIKNALWVFLLLAIIYGGGKAWINKHDIHNVGDVIEFFRMKSSQTESAMRPCVENPLECEINLPEGEGGSGSYSGGSNSGSSSSGNSGGGSSNSNNGGGSNSSGGTGDNSGSSNDNSSESDSPVAGIPVVNESSVEYDRTAWMPGKKWSDFDGDGCDTRESVLKTSGSNVQADPKTCKILAGSWVSPYTGETIDQASKLDIDHIIPLSYAAKHGGQSWDNSTKEQFANDTANLVAVDQSSNRSKGDKGPAAWMPSNEDYQCTYAQDWVNIAKKYSLGLSQNDLDTLSRTIAEKC